MTDSRRFAGRFAVVTGAGSGIGAVVAARFAAEGAELLLVGRGRAALERAAVAAGGAQIMEADVADPGQVARVFALAAADGHHVDAVVHAAGVDDPEAKAEIGHALREGRPPDVTAGLSDERWRSMLSVNLDGAFYVLRAALRAMRPQWRGSVVMVGSASGVEATTGLPHYSAAKAGLHVLAQAVAKEAIAYGVRVNVVAPGPTRTAMTERIPPEMAQAILTSGHGFAEPADIAATIAFVASEEARDLVGAVILSNQGRFTRP